MVQINLIGKKRRGRVGGRNWITMSVLVAFIAFVLYFLGSAIYVVVRLYQIENETQMVNQESEEISRSISTNRDALSKYVLSKHILERISSLKKNRFRYKDYLDGIYKLMPSNAVLTNVDFATKGWVAVSVSLPGVPSLKEMEANLTNTTALASSEFSSVFSESVVEDKNGLYNAKLHFEIKTNGGN